MEEEEEDCFQNDCNYGKFSNWKNRKTRTRQTTLPTKVKAEAIEEDHISDRIAGDQRTVTMMRMRKKKRSQRRSQSIGGGLLGLLNHPLSSTLLLLLEDPEEDRPLPPSPETMRKRMTKRRKKRKERLPLLRRLEEEGVDRKRLKRKMRRMTRWK